MKLKFFFIIITLIVIFFFGLNIHNPFNKTEYYYLAKLLNEKFKSQIRFNRNFKINKKCIEDIKKERKFL